MAEPNSWDRRKAQQIGASTIGATIPADWVAHHGLSKGDQVIIQQDEIGGSLNIVPETTDRSEKVATIAVDDDRPAACRRTIVAQYVLGCTRIEITSDEALSSAMLDEIASAERQLMGLSVIEQGVETVTVRCSVATADFELSDVLTRLWQSETTMRDGVLETVLEGGSAELDLESRQRQLRTVYYLFLRLLFSTYRKPKLNEAVGLRTGFPLIGYRTVAQDVLVMSRSTGRIGTRYTEAGPFDLDGETRTAFESVVSGLDRAVQTTRTAIEAPSCQHIDRAQLAVDALTDRCQAAQGHLETASPEPLLGLQEILEELRLCGDLTMNGLQVAARFGLRARE